MGKTSTTPGQQAKAGKHPHGRGEDVDELFDHLLLGETPPRAWGRPGKQHLRHSSLGNTPTGVGKTQIPTHARCFRQKHPHGRGEDSCPASGPPLAGETPPRAWGRLQSLLYLSPLIGNTPTGVGKTHPRRARRRTRRKHPHGRGEDKVCEDKSCISAETPPRAWGRLFRGHRDMVIRRNTPTGVGKTTGDIDPTISFEKHPHGRGEDKLAPVPWL